MPVEHDALYSLTLAFTAFWELNRGGGEADIEVIQMAPRALCQIPLGGIEFKGVAPKVIALGCQQIATVAHSILQKN